MNQEMEEDFNADYEDLNADYTDYDDGIDDTAKKCKTCENIITGSFAERSNIVEIVRL